MLLTEPDLVSGSKSPGCRQYTTTGQGVTTICPRYHEVLADRTQSRDKKSGWGGVSDDSDFAVTMLSTVYILSFCSGDKIKAVVEKNRPLLNKFGGVFYISDAVMVKSLRCSSKLEE